MDFKDKVKRVLLMREVCVMGNINTIVLKSDAFDISDRFKVSH